MKKEVMSFEFDPVIRNSPVPVLKRVQESKRGADDGFVHRKLKDTTSGFMGGVAQVAIGQPLDLIKVMIQTGQAQSSVQAIKQVYRNEGLLSFYKGSAVPFVGVGFINTIMFNFCYEARRMIARRQNCKEDELSMSQYYFTGSVAGALTSLITSPVEQVRILLQTNRFKNNTECVKALWRTGHMYNGLTLTMLRDAHSHGIWFLTFEYLMAQKRQAMGGVARDQVSTWDLLLYGGIAGDLLWITTYPMDVVKTLKQSNVDLGDGTTKNRTVDIVRGIYTAQGWRGFWAGIGPTLIRAVPVNAGVFATVEICRRFLD